MADLKISQLTDGVTAESTDLTIVSRAGASYSLQLADVQALFTLSGLDDTVITGPTALDLLQWDGSDWVDVTLAEAGVAAASHTHEEADLTYTVDGATDTTITAAATGEILSYIGGAWVDTMPSTIAQVTNEETTGTMTLDLHGLTTLNSVGGAITGTMPDGTIIGQEKIIIMTNATTSSTVSVTTHATSDPEVFTFDAVGEYLILRWMGSDVGGWITIDATATV